jgi:ketosteroid isomerase-like protein
MPATPPSTYSTTTSAALKAKDLDHLGSHCAHDIAQIFATATTLTRESALLDRMQDLLGRVRSLAQRATTVWKEEGDVTMFEVISNGHLHDGSLLEIKACSIFTVANGTFTSQQIYVDNISWTTPSADPSDDENQDSR